MNETELNRIADAWIAAQEAEDGTPEHKANWWAVSQVMDWHFDDEADLLWRFILLSCKRRVSDRVAAVLAAGPLEDLLAKHGSNYIDRVEQLANKDEDFNWLLGGVWRSSITTDVWMRVEAARKEVW